MGPAFGISGELLGMGPRQPCEVDMIATVSQQYRTCDDSEHLAMAGPILGTSTSVAVACRSHAPRPGLCQGPV